MKPFRIQRRDFSIIKSYWTLFGARNTTFSPLLLTLKVRRTETFFLSTFFSSFLCSFSHLSHILSSLFSSFFSSSLFYPLVLSSRFLLFSFALSLGILSSPKILFLCIKRMQSIQDLVVGWFLYQVKLKNHPSFNGRERTTTINYKLLS
jgi:hypothetical protein